MNTKAICTVTLFYYQDLKAVTGLYWMRLVFSIVSLFPRENINLNKKAFWQSILVLVVKLRHRANDLFSSKLVHEFKLMSSSMDNVEGSQKFIWKMQLQVRVSAIISLSFQGAPLSVCDLTVLGLYWYERFWERKKKGKKKEKNWKVVEYSRRPNNKSFHVGDYSNYKKHGQKWKMHVQCENEKRTCKACKYCFSRLNMQICDFLVAVHIVVA